MWIKGQGKKMVGAEKGRGWVDKRLRGERG